MNPPFSLEDWGADAFPDGDPFDRFRYGFPPNKNGDYAWMQHVAKSLKPDGRAIIVMSQGILFRGQPELTEAEDGRNKKADDEYLIRSGFLKDDLLEAVIVLPSGLFYGNNVPACLAVINKRKPAARKNRVLMIWASRHYQHANPQSVLRRADCLRTLLPWRAFGDLEKAKKLLPKEGAAMLAEIERDRANGLKEIAEAYDPAIEPLETLKKEANRLSDKAHLKTLDKDGKAAAKTRLKFAKAQIKAIDKLVKERAERIAEVNRKADRETAEVNEAIADLERICGDPAEARRYFVVAEKTELEENEFNLNLPRYVDTFEPEEEIDLTEALSALSSAEDATRRAKRQLDQLLGTGG